MKEEKFRKFLLLLFIIVALILIVELGIFYFLRLRGEKGLASLFSGVPTPTPKLNNLPPTNFPRAEVVFENGKIYQKAGEQKNLISVQGIVLENDGEKIVIGLGEGEKYIIPKEKIKNIIQLPKEGGGSSSIMPPTQDLRGAVKGEMMVSFDLSQGLLVILPYEKP
ncbi:MAG: hypothetical protein ACPLXP_01620 [Microgenomates group bacterium]